MAVKTEREKDIPVLAYPDSPGKWLLSSKRCKIFFQINNHIMHITIHYTNGYLTVEA